jgi:chromosome segregation protein
LNSLREKFRGTQSLAQERSRFLAEEAEEARSAGRDPEAMDTEAKTLRNEENALRQSVLDAQNGLQKATQELATAEAALKIDEDTIAAAMRAIADAREGTARQEGHIKSLAARLEAIAEEIARLTKARNDAQERVESARREYSTFELEIASADSGEIGLDSQFEGAKNALEFSKKKLADLVEAERGADRERNSVESKLEALQLTTANRDGASALIRDARGVQIIGSIASLIEIDSGWESAAAAALGQYADAVVVQDLSAAVTALRTLRSENLGQADVLVYQPGHAPSNISIPSSLTPVSAHIRSGRIGDLLASLLSHIVVAESANVLALPPELALQSKRRFWQ